MTIRLRLTLYWAAVLATILLVAAIASIKLFERQQWSALDAALLEEGETAAKEIERTNLAGARTVLESLSREVDLGPGRRVRIVTANGVIDDFGNVNTIPPGSNPDLPPRAMIVSNSPFRFAVVPLLLAGEPDRKSTRLNSSHVSLSRMPSSA